MSKVQDVKKQPDFCAGGRFPAPSERYQQGLTEEDILNGSAEAFRGGWNRVKLYFMGFHRDAEICRDCRAVREGGRRVLIIPKEERSGKVQVTASHHSLCEAVHAVQWARMCTKISGAGPHCQLGMKDAEPQESALVA